MAGALNFDGIDAAASKSLTEPGTIDVFKISGVEFADSKTKKTPYMRITFENKDSNFSHSFFLVGKDADKTKKMLSRIQLLMVSVNGEEGKLKGNVTEEGIKKALLNKEVALKVLGEVSSNGKGYPTLGFSAFAKKKEEVDFLSFTSQEQKLIDAAKEAIEASRSGGADQESTGGGMEETPYEEVANSAGYTDEPKQDTDLKF
jgi:hypothetical protein